MILSNLFPKYLFYNKKNVRDRQHIIFTERNITVEKRKDIFLLRSYFITWFNCIVGDVL